MNFKNLGISTFQLNTKSFQMALYWTKHIKNTKEVVVGLKFNNTSENNLN